MAVLAEHSYLARIKIGLTGGARAACVGYMMGTALARFEIVLSRKPASGAEAPAERRVVLGRFGSAVATILLALVGIGLVTAALALGYLFIGLLLAAMFVGIVLAIVRGAFRSIRR
jgi:hypothetical protein